MAKKALKARKGASKRKKKKASKATTSASKRKKKNASKARTAAPKRRKKTKARRARTIARSADNPLPQDRFPPATAADDVFPGGNRFPQLPPNLVPGGGGGRPAEPSDDDPFPGGDRFPRRTSR